MKRISKKKIQTFFLTLHMVIKNSREPYLQHNDSTNSTLLKEGKKQNLVNHLHHNKIRIYNTS